MLFALAERRRKTGRTKRTAKRKQHEKHCLGRALQLGFRGATLHAAAAGPQGGRRSPGIPPGVFHEMHAYRGCQAPRRPAIPRDPASRARAGAARGNIISGPVTMGDYSQNRHKDLRFSQGHLCILRFWPSLARSLLPRSKGTLAGARIQGSCILEPHPIC